MTDHVEYTGAGTAADPLTFQPRAPRPDDVKVAIDGVGQSVGTYEAAFRSAADLSHNLPDDVRKLVSEASSAITATTAAAANARAEADRYRADVAMYPAGRDYMAGEVIRAAADKVSESFASADIRLKVAEASLYEAARPRISADAAMPARADLTMMTQRHMDSPRGLADTLKRLAQRSDGVGALVADESYMGDFLDAHGIERELRDAILTTVRAEVVKTAAESGDAKRAAAGKTSLALAELKRARAAAASYTRHKLSGK
ncbi:hypothetical protein [Streptomyces sp. NPDC055681]